MVVQLAAGTEQFCVCSDALKGIAPLCGTCTCLYHMLICGTYATRLIEKRCDVYAATAVT